MANALLQILEMLETLSTTDTDTATFAARFDVGPATVKRMVSDARLYGAVIVSVKVGKRHLWRLENWPACEKRVKSWLVLERARSFV
jgi:predicted DNA-binding transcriptional regulator YafY